VILGRLIELVSLLDTARVLVDKCCLQCFFY